MKPRDLLTITGLVWFGFTSAQARNFYNGNELLQKCGGDRQTSESLFCSAYIAGVADALQATRMICLPKAFVVGQARDVVVNYLRSHPDGRHYSAASEAALALVKVFPCN